MNKSSKINLYTLLYIITEIDKTVKKDKQKKKYQVDHWKSFPYKYPFLSQTLYFISYDFFLYHNIWHSMNINNPNPVSAHLCQ